MAGRLGAAHHDITDSREADLGLRAGLLFVHVFERTTEGLGMIYIHAESVHLAENFARVDLGLSRHEYRAFGNWSRLHGMRILPTDRVIFYGWPSAQVQAVVRVNLIHSGRGTRDIEWAPDGR
jgi:hypothetical protein